MNPLTIFLVATLVLASQFQFTYSIATHALKRKVGSVGEKSSYPSVMAMLTVALLGGVAADSIGGYAYYGILLIVAGLVIGAWGRGYKNGLFGKLFWLYLCSEVFVALVTIMHGSTMIFLSVFAVMFAISIIFVVYSTKKLES